MTQEQEKELLQAIYDRLFDAITYQPASGVNPFKESETFIHFSKNAAVNPETFRNLCTPTNPQGDLKASEEFSNMVDQVSPMALEWENSDNPLSAIYKEIVDSANTTVETKGKNMDIYTRAYNYLHPEVTTKNPFLEETITERTDSADYVAYENNMNDYVTAIYAYRMGYNAYLDELTDKDANVRAKADRNWQMSSILLESKIKSAYNKLNVGNARFVKQALDILSTTINDGIRQAIVSAREAVADEHAYTSSLGLGKWFLSYPIPSNWMNEDCNGFTHLKISGGNTTLKNKNTVHHFELGGSLNYGLWKVKASSEGKFEHSTSSTDIDSIEISADIIKVQIRRPWFMESLFRLANWTTDMAKDGGISNGKIDSTNKGLIPMYPVAFIVAKNIFIKADFTHEDEEKINDAVSAKTSVGWGPFSLSGSYGYGNTEQHFHSDYQNGTIEIPGMQIIAWVSRVMPFSTKNE